MSPEEMVVGFVQVYSASTGHRETTRKSMIWRWSDGHWRIVSEQATKVASNASQDVALARVEPVQPVEAKVPEPTMPETKALEPKAATRAQRDEVEPRQASKARRELEAAQAALAKAQRDADAAQAKANREAEALQARVKREAELAQAKAQRDAELTAASTKREADLARIRADLESKQMAAKAARDSQITADKAAREAENAANQAKREVEAATANARKEEKRLAREILSVATAAAAPAEPPNVTPTISPNTASFEPAVRAWIKAWNDQQAEAYLASYAANFEVPGGQDRAAWAAERRESMTRPAWIKVRADNLKISVSGDSAEARFFQVYVVAPGTVDLSNKTMRWHWLDGRWKIVQEQSEPHLRKRGGK
jgi:type II secretory pathway component PulJ